MRRHRAGGNPGDRPNHFGGIHPSGIVATGCLEIDTPLHVVSNTYQLLIQWRQTPCHCTGDSLRAVLLLYRCLVHLR